MASGPSYYKPLDTPSPNSTCEHTIFPSKLNSLTQLNFRVWSLKLDTFNRLRLLGGLSSRKQCKLQLVNHIKDSYL